MRTCLGCRTRRPAGNLVRVARLPDGSLQLSRVAPGRGAWLCPDPRTGVPRLDCLDLAVRRNAFTRAYRAEVSAAALAPLRAFVLRRENMEEPIDRPAGNRHEQGSGRPAEMDATNVAGRTQKGLTQ